jgi:hypothetical protein
MTLRPTARFVESTGNRLAALITNMLGAHYPVKSGMYSMTAGETAQGINNPQVLYSFIRGAARQYGTRWYADISTWNRFGNKQPYARRSCAGGLKFPYCDPKFPYPPPGNKTTGTANEHGDLDDVFAAEPYPGAHLYCDMGSCTCPGGPNASCPDSGGCD